MAETKNQMNFTNFKGLKNQKVYEIIANLGGRKTQPKK